MFRAKPTLYSYIHSNTPPGCEMQNTLGSAQVSLCVLRVGSLTERHDLMCFVDFGCNVRSACKTGDDAEKRHQE